MKALVAILSLAMLVACSGESESRGRVLVIGVDGASQRLVKELMEAGRLPHLELLARDGATGISRPSFPLLSPRIWTSVVTGKRPSQHGIEGWVWLDGQGTPHLYSSKDRKAPALWNILGAAGRTTGVVNWLMTHPPEKIAGVIISDHAAEGVMADKVEFATDLVSGIETAEGAVQVKGSNSSLAFPDSWNSRLTALREGEPLTTIPDPFGDSEEWKDVDHTRFMRRIYANDEFATRLALEIDKSLKPDLLLVYLPGVDRISHFLWDSIEPLEAIPEHQRSLPGTREKHGRALRSYYEFVDQLIGRLQEHRTPEDLVIVLSDHGFELNPNKARLNGHHSPAARDGILFMRGRGVPVGGSGLKLRMIDFAPTILAWLGLPPAADMAGEASQSLTLEISPSVSSYDNIPIEYVDAEASGSDAKIIENLKELGYVEE